MSGGGFLKYGGATTCVLVRLAGQAAVLDAGTGLLDLPSLLDAGEDRLLWARDKWLIAHPEAPAVQRGAHPGLHVVDYEIRYR